MKISLIRKYFDTIWTSCFGKDRPVPKMYEPHERVIYNKIREDLINDHNQSLQPSCDLFVF